MSKEHTPYVEEVRLIIEQIYKRSTHSYVEYYVDVPSMAENRLELLYLFLLEQGMTKERAVIFCTATGLVQLGLDMHEHVKNEYEQSQTAERNRQLTVLAGDYYSSRYYHLLAQASEIQAIQVLSGAVQRVNEAKMKLYVAGRDGKLPSDEEYWELRNMIDTLVCSDRGRICGFRRQSSFLDQSHEGNSKGRECNRGMGANQMARTSSLWFCPFFAAKTRGYSRTGHVRCRDEGHGNDQHVRANGAYAASR